MQFFLIPFAIQYRFDAIAYRIRTKKIAKIAMEDRMNKKNY